MESYAWINYYLAVRKYRTAKPIVFLSQSFKTQRQVGIRKGYTDDSGSCCLLESVMKDIQHIPRNTLTLYVAPPHSPLHTTSIFFFSVPYSCFLQPSVQSYPHNIPSIPSIFFHLSPLFSPSLRHPFFPYLSLFSSFHSSFLHFIYLYKNIMC